LTITTIEAPATSERALNMGVTRINTSTTATLLTKPAQALVAGAHTK
jgi:hypothetical protein